MRIDERVKGSKVSNNRIDRAGFLGEVEKGGRITPRKA
jgi:hypothetical protein